MQLSLTVRPVVPAGYRHRPGFPGVYWPHHPASVCGQDPRLHQALGPGPRSVGGSEGGQ